MDEIRMALEKYLDVLSKYKAGRINYDVLEKARLDYEKSVEVYTWRGG